MAKEFSIGFEAEVLLTPAQNTPALRDLEVFTNWLAARYNENTASSDLRLYSDITGMKGGDPSEAWTITDDITIETTFDRQWPVEIVSPILLHRGSDWRADVESLFRAIRRYCLIETNHSFGFHVHFAPLGKAWEVNLLKPFCRAILYFERAFEALLPAHRRGNEYAKSLLADNEKLNGKTLRQMFQELSQCHNNTEIVALMNCGRDRFFGWNFVNLLQGGTQTVEFRRGPGVVLPIDCRRWVEMVVTFADVSLTTDDTRLLSYTMDVDGLWRFISDGVSTETDLEILCPIFEGKSGFLNPSTVGNLTGQQQRKLHQKQEEAEGKNLIPEKMKLMFPLS